MAQVRKPMLPDGPVRVFFERLHALHAAAGHPSMRELQRRTRSRQRPNGINPTTIHDALSGPRLGSWETVLALVTVLRGDVDEVSALWRAARAAGDAAAAPPADPGVTIAVSRVSSVSRVSPVGATGAARGAADGADGPAADGPAPHELPPDVSPFVGRIGELAELDRSLAAVEHSSAVAITAVCGTAGVGKSALAVHWAHRAAARFPHGNLYMDLRGYDRDQPVPPGEALAAFLRTLGADPSGGVAERAARYRSLVAGRRMLIVLDNARDADHVRPLLPGTPSCFVVVTSRDSLAGLVARHGAQRMHLGRFSAAEAAELVRALTGARADTEPAAVGLLAERCAWLPLALRIAAELADASAVTTLTDVVCELADDRRRLDVLDAGDDPCTAIRAVFSWSYRQLPPDAARMFRLLGLGAAPRAGGDFDVAAMAALAGADEAEAGRLANLLARAHLIERTGPGRFAMHELLRAYAASLGANHDPDADRRAAVTRLLDHQGVPAAPDVRFLGEPYQVWLGRAAQLPVPHQHHS